VPVAHMAAAAYSKTSTFVGWQRRSASVNGSVEASHWCPTCGQTTHVWSNNTRVVKQHMWSNNTCGQTTHVVKQHMWSNNTCGQTTHVWSNNTCGQTTRVVKQHMQTRSQRSQWLAALCLSNRATRPGQDTTVYVCLQAPITTLAARHTAHPQASCCDTQTKTNSSPNFTPPV
jgi:predicted RNA-binding Zn-ribbon protein involved in translation (DUF1610 family)